MSATPGNTSLVFTGFMGSGKSRALCHARSAGLDAVDTDELLAAELGGSIEEFFEAEGEDEFRRREAELVLRVLGEGHEAIALGGGAVMAPGVRAALAEHTVVWFRVPVADLWRRASGSGRPLARDEARFRALYAQREPLYREVASAVLLSADAVPGALPALRAPGALTGARLIWAESASGAYPVWVGPEITGRIPWPAKGRRFVITDAIVGELYATGLEAEATVRVEAGERSKTLSTAERVLGELASAGMTRSDHVVAVGGGVVGDLAGFCAATYQRGVPVVQVPTTLLAQVDAAIGGKTGVDLPQAKNYVGAYHLPAGVVADTTTLATLPAEELAAGFAEVLKTALLAGPNTWRRALELTALEPSTLEPLVFECALEKVEVVAADERDSGRREALNLGHTVGHAIEVAGAYESHRHGEAVGLGMLAALRLSGAEALRDELQAALERHDLPVRLGPEIDTDAVLEATRLDKKATESGPRFVLLERPGEVVTGVELETDRVRAAVEELRR